MQGRAGGDDHGAMSQGPGRCWGKGEGSAWMGLSGSLGPLEGQAKGEGARAGRVTLNSLSMGSLLCRRWDKSRRL